MFRLPLQADPASVSPPFHGESQLESFLARAKADPALLQRLQACANLDAIAALGLELGHSFSGVDLVRHQAEATLRLSEEELEAAAAGVALQGHLWLMRIVWA